MTTHKIGLIGSGAVAKTLAQGLASKGHDVRIGSRDPHKLADYTAQTGVKSGTFEDVAAHGEIVVLAVKGSIAVDAAAMVSKQIAGKIVIDTTNPMTDGPPVDGSIVPFFTGPSESLMERLQKAEPAARFVKAWNSVGAPMMIDPKLTATPSMFIAGNDDAAKKTVAALLASVGWIAEDVGKASGARAIEPLCQLWCAAGFLRGDWAHAYAVVRPAK